MGRPPSHGGPTFRFTQIEVGEMEVVLQDHNNAMPSKEILVTLSDKFSESADRKGKIGVHFKQVWNWFQNKRYAIRAKTNKAPGKLNVSSTPRDDTNPVRNVPQHVAAPTPAPRPAPMPVPLIAPSPTPVPAAVSAPLVPNVGRAASESAYLEFEAKYARDGAWYDVQNFLAHRHLETGDPEVQVRFSGFGPDEDEWVNVKKHVRQRSLPCEASECVAVLPGDLILCFQEGKDQALYFDAHVLDAQRRRHDVRGCRCRFLVRYDHDQSEEIVALRKICRRPETDFRLQQLHAANDIASTDPQKMNMGLRTNAGRVVTSSVETEPQKQQGLNSAPLLAPAPAPVSHVAASTTSLTTTPEPKTPVP